MPTDSCMIDLLHGENYLLSFDFCLTTCTHISLPLCPLSLFLSLSLSLSLLFSPSLSYKVVCPATWPLFNGSMRDATGAILSHTKLAYDAEFGHTKIFIRSPQTLTALERKRAEAIPKVVLILQRVSVPYQTY